MTRRKATRGWTRSAGGEVQGRNESPDGAIDVERYADAAVVTELVGKQTTFGEGEHTVTTGAVMRERRPETPGLVAIPSTGSMSVPLCWQIASQVPQRGNGGQRGQRLGERASTLEPRNGN